MGSNLNDPWSHNGPGGTSFRLVGRDGEADARSPVEVESARQSRSAWSTDVGARLRKHSPRDAEAAFIPAQRISAARPTRASRAISLVAFACGFGLVIRGPPTRGTALWEGPEVPWARR